MRRRIVKRIVKSWWESFSRRQRPGSCSRYRGHPEQKRDWRVPSKERRPRSRLSSMASKTLSSKMRTKTLSSKMRRLCRPLAWEQGSDPRTMSRIINDDLGHWDPVLRPDTDPEAKRHSEEKQTWTKQKILYWVEGLGAGKTMTFSDEKNCTVDPFVNHRNVRYIAENPGNVTGSNKPYMATALDIVSSGHFAVPQI